MLIGTRKRCPSNREDLKAESLRRLCGVCREEQGDPRTWQTADLAVLSQDIFTVSASDLPRTTSLLTIVGGKVVYNANVIKQP
jgi:hypothetical protein